MQKLFIVLTIALVLETIVMIVGTTVYVTNSKTLSILNQETALAMTKYTYSYCDKVADTQPDAIRLKSFCYQLFGIPEN